MRRHVGTLPSVQSHTGVAFEDFEQTAESVLAHARRVETGELMTIQARFLAGCDGAHSPVRRQLGIGMSGDDALANSLAAVLQAPTWRRCTIKAPALHYWTINPETPGIVGPLDTAGRWWFHLNAVPAGKTYSAGETRQLFVRAAGAEFPCDVVASDTWSAPRLVADRYRERRVFLLGDAAHLHPPMGGYGMNMGIGDAVDLGWKLGAVCTGWGGEGLLESYSLERRPIHVC